jgi:cytochrome c biogenesis protein CcmG/thiol:disulfide interchange protein DsbE
LSVVLWTLTASNIHAAGILSQWLLSEKGGEPSGGAERQSPSFVLPDLKGRPFSSRDLRKHYVLLDFWATWCPPCRQSIPELIRLSADYQRRGLKVVGINLDESKSDVPPFIRQFKIPYPVLLGGDSSIMDRFGVRGLPSFYLLDPDGKIIRTWVGYGEDLPEEWRRLLDHWL